MSDALARAGDSHLLVYGEGAEETGGACFTLHRASRSGATAAHRVVSAASLRSGPSLGKLARDVGLVLALRRLVARLQPDVVCAHHVEACAAAIAAHARPLVFVAHTALAPELPTYLPDALRPLLAPALGVAGDVLDAALARRADAVLAVSPALAGRLSRASGVAVHPIAVPWEVPTAIDAAERAQARAALGLTPRDEVVLYAGNLDGYQGLACVWGALSRLSAARPGLRVLVATASAEHPIRATLAAHGLAARTVFTSLARESERRRAYAAADVAVVPRGAVGGVPIKLLDALARGVPVVVQRRATAGLAVDDFAFVCADDDEAVLAASLAQSLDAGDIKVERALRGRAWIADAHAPGRFVASLQSVLRDALRDACRDARVRGREGA
jgi:glycosyltransferase involved in cell wall biosynthesis